MPGGAWWGCGVVMRTLVMAAARDQTARVIRPEPGTADGDAATGLGEQLRAHVVDETQRHPVEPDGAPPAGNPTVAPTGAPAPAVAAAKPGKRKFVMMGVLALVALAAASYAVYYVFVG